MFKFFIFKKFLMRHLNSRWIIFDIKYRRKDFAKDILYALRLENETTLGESRKTTGKISWE